MHKAEFVKGFEVIKDGVVHVGDDAYNMFKEVNIFKRKWLHAFQI